MTSNEKNHLLKKKNVFQFKNFKILTYLSNNFAKYFLACFFLSLTPSPNTNKGICYDDTKTAFMIRIRNLFGTYITINTSSS